MNIMLKGSGAEQPNADGLWGGCPGGINLYQVVRESDVRKQMEGGSIPGRIEEMHGKVERMPPKGIGLFGPKDALYYYVQGGGGWGDPIEREPDKVAWDYRNGLVSVDCAKGSYGVVLDEKTGEVIQDKTIELRGSMTAERLD